MITNSSPVLEPDQTIESESTEIERALRYAAVRATLAPSIHNAQPWRFVVHPRSLDLYAARSRLTPVIDPTGRQLAIGCGRRCSGPGRRSRRLSWTR